MNKKRKRKRCCFMLNLISEKEKEMMLDYIKEYAFHNARYSSRQLGDFDYLFRFWDKSKQKYLKQIFGDKLILEKEVNLVKTNADLANDLDDALYNEGENEEICDFISEIKCIDYNNVRLYGVLDELTSVETLAENEYKGESISFTNPATGKEIKIQKGCKPVRTIGKIAKEFNIKGFEEFRKIHSIVLTKKNLTGKLCLSIHPFDYMTMSDNNSNWSSCMNWMEEGCYRQGTVEMMNSKMVIVAYLKANNDFVTTKDYTWNNKKWRELFIINKDIITNIKGYPYASDALTLATLNWLKELAAAADFGNFSDTAVYWDNDTNPKNITVNTVTNYMYNDFCSECRHYSYFNKEILDNVDTVLTLSYSGISECMATGEADPDIDENTCALVSVDADEYDKCSCCGRPIYDDERYHFRDECICESCWENLKEDVITEEYYYEDEVEPIRVAKDGKVLYYFGEIWVSKETENLKSVFEEKFNVPLYYSNDSGYYIEAKEASPEIAKAFHFYSLNSFMNCLSRENYL